MSTSRLKLYNAALTICGETVLASLSEDRESKRLLDQVWDNDGVDACLEEGQWKFATRTVRIDYDVDVEPDFGYQYAFSKPSDWISTVALCSDEYFKSPLLQYSDESDYWYSDLSEIYVKYVSNDTYYGNDLSLWPPSFTNFVAASFAAKIIMKLTSDEKKMDSVVKWETKMLKKAKSKDSMAGPTQFPPPGNFVSSRGRSRGRDDRGNRNSLLG